MKNAEIIDEILKLNCQLLNYLQNNVFNGFEAECKRQDLIQYLFNNNSFYYQNKNRITSDEYNSDRITCLLTNISSNYKAAVSFISQRGNFRYDVKGKLLTDFDFYVAIRTKVIDNCEKSTLEINSIINRKKTK